MVFWILRVLGFAFVAFYAIERLCMRLLPAASASIAFVGFAFLLVMLVFIHFRMIQAWAVRGRAEKAVRHIIPWWWLLPPLQYYLTLVELLLLAGDYETAEAAIDGARNSYAEYWTDFQLSHLARFREQSHNAEHYALEAITGAGKPFHRAVFQLDLAGLYINHMSHLPGKLDAAERHLDAAEPPLEGNALFQALHQGARGRLMVRRGGFAEGLELLRQAIPSVKSSAFMNPILMLYAAELLLYAGMAERALGERDEARKTWEYATSLVVFPELNQRIEAELQRL